MSASDGDEHSEHEPEHWGSGSGPDFSISSCERFLGDLYDHFGAAPFRSRAVAEFLETHALDHPLPWNISRCLQFTGDRRSRPMRIGRALGNFQSFEFGKKRIRLEKTRMPSVKGGMGWVIVLGGRPKPGKRG